ncbi:hypothetical protein GCM10017786_08200 [Amycolatopsis deserti]|uniref:Response regulatory domain-containing protein n=1 Tax=Amycolatopsis deserti TaxID=185696 RepID=A0ABQ3IHC7_9PSEU|nr:response regulator transcription factor [Amycolatopsis deserti]GHE80440.1 hypothetical protein GCM10017786_08200 [Amycolatopsis deserti]
MTRDARPASLRVLVVDDHAGVRRAIRAYLEVLGITVAGEAADGRQALNQLDLMAARNDLPDVVLLDLVMPNMDGVTATGRIRRRYPDVRVFILTSFGSQERIDAALSRGAAGFLHKDVEPAELVAALHRTQQTVHNRP